MSIYEEINSEILIIIGKEVKSTTASSWRQLSAYFELVKGIEELTLTMTSHTLLAMYADYDVNTLAAFQRHQASTLEHLQFSIQYLEAEGMISNYPDLASFEKMYKDIRATKADLDAESDWENETETTKERALKEIDKTLVLASKSSIVKLKNVQNELRLVVGESIKDEVWVARRALLIGIIILVIVFVVSPILILLSRHTVLSMQSFTKTIEHNTRQLVIEKQKSDLLLSKMLPKPVLRHLRSQRCVPAESFEAVTVFFSDIAGFTNISANSTPIQVINMLNMLYKLFDEIILKYNVYKVETIGDAYMVVSGLPERNGQFHASEIADMSLSMVRSLDGATVPHRPQEKLRIRIGLNTGPCVAGVVGTTMPRYALFGDTINTASRMESTGEVMKIHISETTNQALEELGGYEIEYRGEMEVPGKGSMKTYWLLGKIDGNIEPESPRCLRLNDYDENLLEQLLRI